MDLLRRLERMTAYGVFTNPKDLDKVKELLQFAESNRGLPYMLKEPRILAERHEAGIRHAEQQMQVHQPPGTDVVVIGKPYLPCTEPVSQLEKIALAELKTETHHRGKFLLVRRTMDWIFTKTSVAAVIVDDSGIADVVKLTMGCQGLNNDTLLPKDQAIVVKEPYYSFEEEKLGVVIVEHPCDIVLVDLDNSIVPTALRQIDCLHASKTGTALALKNQGNEHFKRGEYHQSLKLYTRAFDAVDPNDFALRCDILRNRAQTNIHLSRFDAAEEDALSAMLSNSHDQAKKLDVKAWFRAGFANYQLRRFSQAQSHFQSLLELCPHDAEATKMMARVQSRLAEQSSGHDDFERIVRNLSNAQPRVDVADHTKKTEVKQSDQGRGRGLFATEDIKPRRSDTVAVFSDEGNSTLFTKWDVRADDAFVSNIELWRSVVKKLSDNPSLLKQVTSLHSGHAGLGTSKLEVDGNVVVDTFQIHDIVARNAFGMARPSHVRKSDEFGVCEAHDDNRATHGIWCHTSYLNHSCVPNANRVFLGDLILVRAVGDIARGEELTLGYCSHGEYEERRQNMKSIWRFDCQCPLCSAEGLDGEALRKSRERLGGEVRSVLQMPEGTNDDDVSEAEFDAVQAQKIQHVVAFKATYPAKRYIGLPKYALHFPQQWIANTYYNRGMDDKALVAICDYFKSLGYLEARIGSDGVVLKASKHATVTRDAVRLLGLAVRIEASRAPTSKGHAQAALKLEQLAKKLYLTVNGVEAGYKPRLICQGPSGMLENAADLLGSGRKATFLPMVGGRQM
ncbi:uncharacterized protein LTR77_004800 [Saxophila tyrrhenica]|uniref:SET domain-containing protein n=1 Tax=Saxophila tyrrhenica TaxID=1690608 RepID=A0AAV9PAG0_9PEZI|nr:hypothetical protein LTR77_004800 [Saxophila tyrrhenica]